MVGTGADGGSPISMLPPLAEDVKPVPVVFVNEYLAVDWGVG